ncbi:MAG: SDR family oxidoreductase [Cytophagaceae bacterium]|nr:SDR family oxidoreductase [Cytophagaceae bacterium]
MKPLIVVTGGTKGIGRAILERFAQGGFDGIVCARTDEALRQLETDFAEQFPANRLQTFRADLAERAGIEALVGFVQNQNRPVDVLINNAGTFRPGQIHNEEEGTFEVVMATNIQSAYHLTRGLVGAMITRRQGYIVNICSTASITAYTNGGSYCISKYALLGLSRVLREELKTYGIKVTAVLPGATLTDSWAASDLPPERFMLPQDVAELVWTSYSLSPGAVVEEILMRPQLGDI